MSGGRGSSVIQSRRGRILEGWIFQIIEAEDGEKALEVCKRPFPRRSCSTGNMPVWTAIEFLGNLAPQPGGDAPKWCSAPPRTCRPYRARAFHAGANEYIHETVRQGHRDGQFQEVGLI